MPVQSSDLVLIERSGNKHKATAGEIAALGGAGGGGLQSISCQIDFGARGSFARVVVAAPWVTNTTRFIISPALPQTADHDPEDVLIEAISAAVVEVQPGIGFTLAASAPYGSWGRYDFNVMGE